MRRRLYAPIVLGIGLLITQLIATVHVHLSNLELLHTSDQIIRAGYLMIPNAQVQEHLGSLTTAMTGGLFFTLSIGTGLSLVTLISVWLWDRVFQRSRKATLVGGCIWIMGLFLINDNGWNPMASTYLFAVPLLTGICAVALLPEQTTLLSSSIVLWPVSVVIILTLMWGLVLNKNLFTNVRDYLLLANRIGEPITNAYYTYTLFPAEAFKSLNQKQIRTCRLGNTIKNALRYQMERTLRSRDYLPVPGDDSVDLTIERDAQTNQLQLKNSHRTVLHLSQKKFFIDPGKALTTYSQNQDRYGNFRTLTLFCLLLGLPLVLFTFTYCFLSLLPHMFIATPLCDIVAAIFCIGIGTALWIPVYQGHIAAKPQSLTDNAPYESSTVDRITALKQANKNRKDIFEKTQEFEIEESSNIAERYWLARSMVHSAQPKATAVLLKLADDPVPIIACQALWAMGQRGDRKMIPQVIEKITESSHWYVQMYGYRTLRKLGWVQPRSPQLFY